MDTRADDDDITVPALGNRKYRPPNAPGWTLHARLRVSVGRGCHRGPRRRGRVPPWTSPAGAGATVDLAVGGGHEPGAPGVRVVYQDPSHSPGQQRKTNVTVR